MIIQEGVSTPSRRSTTPSPNRLIYMMDHYVVGGFYRVHTQRVASDENLNAPGMHFEPLAFEAPAAACPTATSNPDAPPNRFYAYGVVARLALSGGLGRTGSKRTGRTMTVAVAQQPKFPHD